MEVEIDYCEEIYSQETVGCFQSIRHEGVYEKRFVADLEEKVSNTAKALEYFCPGTECIAEAYTDKIVHYEPNQYEQAEGFVFEPMGENSLGKAPFRTIRGGQRIHFKGDYSAFVDLVYAMKGMGYGTPDKFTPLHESDPIDGMPVVDHDIAQAQQFLEEVKVEKIVKETGRQDAGDMIYVNYIITWD